MAHPMRLDMTQVFQAEITQDMAITGKSTIQYTMYRIIKGHDYLKKNSQMLNVTNLSIVTGQPLNVILFL